MALTGSILGRTVTGILSTGGDKYQQRRQAIKKRKITIEDFASQVARESQVRQAKDLQRLHLILLEIEKPMQRAEHDSEVSVRIVEAIERKKIFSWISRIPYQKHHAESRKRVLAGTGRWLFTHPSFLQWKHSSLSEILWLHGIPGSGKSTLL